MSAYGAVFIEVKNFRICPNISAVFGNKYGYVSDDGDVFFMGIGFEYLPLSKKKVLIKLMGIYRARECVD